MWACCKAGEHYLQKGNFGERVMRWPNKCWSPCFCAPSCKAWKRPGLGRASNSARIHPKWTVPLEWWGHWSHASPYFRRQEAEDWLHEWCKLHSGGSRLSNHQVFSGQGSFSSDTTRGASYYHSFMLLGDIIAKNLLIPVRNFIDEMSIGFAVQHVLMSYNACTRLAGLGILQNSLQHYIM